MITVAITEGFCARLAGIITPNVAFWREQIPSSPHGCWVFLLPPDLPFFFLQCLDLSKQSGNGSKEISNLQPLCALVPGQWIVHPALMSGTWEPKFGLFHQEGGSRAAGRSTSCKDNSSAGSRDNVDDKSNGNVFSSQLRAFLPSGVNQTEAPSSSKSSRKACRLISIWTSTTF